VPWPALDSTFDDRARAPAQTLRGAGFELWVTHQVNISALTGAGAAMGQALWLTRRSDGSIATAAFDWGEDDDA
jgi:hypothetical protein